MRKAFTLQAPGLCSNNVSSRILLLFQVHTITIAFHSNPYVT